MMVEDGSLKPAPSDDELHPSSVPAAGGTATLSSTDEPVVIAAAEVLPSESGPAATAASSPAGRPS
jgi:hypothetical protein